MLTELRLAIERSEEARVSEIVASESEENIREENQEGLTALALACRLDQSQCVKALMPSKTSDELSVNKCGYTSKQLYQALVEAADNNSPSSLTILLSNGIDVNLNYDYQLGKIFHADRQDHAALGLTLKHVRLKANRFKSLLTTVIKTRTYHTVKCPCSHVMSHHRVPYFL